MTTAEALEGLGEAEFELLAVRSLRELEPDCKAIIHLGMNAQGKTIPGPLDGFCRVPGFDPPRFVMIAATATMLSKLKGKWLSAAGTGQTKRGPSHAAKSNEGDLPKAAQKAASLRDENPSASFVLHLATNRRLPSELENAARRAGDLERLEVRFLEQSRLRDFLDTKPIGQWLRQEHLKIEADQVSIPLIQQISKESMRRYSNDVATFDGPSTALVTKSSTLLREKIQDLSVCMHLLVGPSGVGKSVAALNALQCHVEGGGLGLWLSSEVVEASLSLADAVRTALASMHPSFGSDAGASALALATERDPFVLIVDDINRSRSPLRVLKKLLSWMRPSNSVTADTSIPIAHRIHVLCPLWNTYWSAIRSDAESNGWIHVQPMTQFARPESIRVLKNSPRSFSDLDADHYAEALQDDPILIGLFVHMLTNSPAANPVDLCKDAIGGFIRRSIDELALAHGQTPQSYVSAIDDLAKKMIEQKSFHPSWTVVQMWLANTRFVLDRIDAAASQGHICRIRDRNGEQVFEFRHDRLLEFCISRAIKACLLSPASEQDPVFDPYFVPYLGYCLAHENFGDDVLEQVLNCSPVSIVASLRSLSPEPNDYTKHLVDRASAWIISAGGLSASKDDAIGILRESDTPFTLEVTHKSGDFRFWDARLRCGDAHAGALSLSRSFFPESHFAWLENLIEQASMRHHSELVAGLMAILLPDERNVPVLRGALSLAGYLADASLAPTIAASWEGASLPVRREILLWALWAGLRCSDDDPRSVLSPLVEAILELDDTKGANAVRSERDSLLTEIGSAGRHGYSAPVLAFLTEIGADQRFESTVVALLERVDHPIAVKFMVERLAWRNERAHKEGGFNLFATHWIENWDAKHAGEQISFQSLAEIRQLWEGSAKPEWLRSYAFSCWAELSPSIDVLRTLDPTAYPHDKPAVRSRALAGDRSVTKEYLAYLNEDWHWLHMMPEIWSPELLPIAGSWLARIRDLSESIHSDLDHVLARVIRDIPISDGEALLVENWDTIGDRPLFVQAALHVSSNKTRALANQSISEWRRPEDPFKHIDHLFFTGTNRIRPADRLTAQQLEGLCPYLHRLSARMLGQMLDFCGKQGYLEFARTHLLAECRAQLHESTSTVSEDAWIRRSVLEWLPTAGELADELSRIAAEKEPQRAYQVEMWTEGFMKRDQPQEAIFEILRKWLADSPTEEHFVVSAFVVRYWGKRRHLNLLENCPFAQSDKGRALLEDSRYDVFRRSLE